jgi:hypothetical protein
MPQHVNLHEAGIRQSPHLKELADNRQANVKAHITWASKVTKVVTLLLIFSFVSNVSNLPSCNISPTVTLAEKMVSCFHKVNKLYNCTLNAIHSSNAFSAVALDMSNNSGFTYTKAMHQPNSVQFIEAMTKEIYNHESKNYCEIVPHSTIPPRHNTIQAI